MMYTATSKILRKDGRKVATIKGWLDSQMMFENLVFLSQAERDDWVKYYNAHKKAILHGVNLELEEGHVLYNVIHKRYTE